MSDDKKDPRHAAMLAALAEGATWEEAADRVGVSERTLRRWCQADPELAKAAAKARDDADDMVEAVTFANCLDPDPSHNSLRMFWLKSRRPQTYRDTNKTIHEFSNLSDEELIRRTTGDPPGDVEAGA